MPSSREQLFERFWSRIQINGPDACWPWQRATTAAGYGLINLGPQADGRDRLEFAHRLAWETTNGLIPPDQQVLHRCDNPPCCNPSHLFLGSNADNIRDSVAKGRRGRALTADQVLAIRTAYAGTAETITSLASRYGVPFGTIHAIVRGRVWKQLPVAPRRANKGWLLDVDKVRAIRAAYRGRRGDLLKLAREYKVTVSTIFDVVHRRSWRMV